MENEKRLIDANAIKYRTIGCGGWGRPEEVVDKYDIEKMPTVDAVEVVHGSWKHARYTEAPLYVCSECDKPEYKQHRYCPNCGAKMDGDGNG